MDVISRNNVKITGKGTQPMLFAHGFGCDQNMWRFVAPEFEDDYKVILFDYVGSGKSDLNAYSADKYTKLDGYAMDVLEIVRELDLHDVIFVGHSVSSMIGVLAANEEPNRFAKIIMIGPSPRYINDGEYFGGFEQKDIEGLFDMMDKNFIGWANFLAPAIMKNSDRPELGKELTDSFCSTDPLIARNFAKATFYADNRADLSGLRVPSLVLQCAEDMVAPTQVGEYVKGQLANSEIRFMKAIGHCPHMSHPEETTTLIKEYLAQAAAA